MRTSSQDPVKVFDHPTENLSGERNIHRTGNIHFHCIDQENHPRCPLSCAQVKDFRIRIRLSPTPIHALQYDYFLPRLADRVIAEAVLLLREADLSWTTTAGCFDRSFDVPARAATDRTLSVPAGTPAMTCREAEELFLACLAGRARIDEFRPPGDANVGGVGAASLVRTLGLVDPAC